MTKSATKAKESKLFQLKEWLTPAAAAHHLSTVLREDVNEAEVLRLALDRHLTLSVNFVMPVMARRGRIVSIDKARYRKAPPEIVEMMKRERGEKSVRSVMILDGIKLDGERVLELDLETVTLGGVYDLPMVGAERSDIEDRFQRLTGGPQIPLGGLDGAFVQEDEVTLYQLQESWENNEFQAGSRAALRKLKGLRTSGGLRRYQPVLELKNYAEDRKEFLARMKARPEHERFYPAGCLPQEAVLVVRIKALREFFGRLQIIEETREGKVNARAETAYTNIIGGLLDLMLGSTPSGKKQSVFKDQAAIIEALNVRHGDKYGLSKRNLEDKFAAAKLSLDRS